MTLPRRVEWFRVLPFFLLHAACLLVFVVGWSWIAVGAAIFVHFARVFGLTAFYHRYFSHRAFKTGRIVQFLGALLGSSAGQRGPNWWEIDISYYLLVVMSWFGLVWDMRPVPRSVLESARVHIAVESP